ncbi:MAG: DUF445 domain-containing protein [Spirochaetia bacterium]|jgi:uncharacterized membrane-anchored protein YjiN (DUF445 family)
MTSGRNRIGILSLAAALAGFLFVTFQPWIPMERVLLFRGLSLRTLLTAFFDASLVGSLADWFAVTALFRSPLGIRLPHTDILARNRIAIAEAVPRFLTSFVNEERMEAELGVVDFAAKVEGLLEPGDARDGINDFLRARLASLLANVARPGGEPSESVTAVVREIIAYAGERVDPVSAAGALIQWGQKEGVGERLIEGGAEALRAGIAGNLESLTDTLTPILKRNAGWQGIFVGRGTVERLLRGAHEELGRLQADPGHDLRVLMAHRLEVLSSRLSGETPDPDPVRGRLRAWFRKLVEDPLTASRATWLLTAALDRLRSAVQAERTGFVQGIGRVEEVFISQLKANPEFRRSFNRGVAGLVSSLIAKSGLIEGVTGYLAGLLKNTDEREFVSRVEDAVWNDLQYIRVNGAVVGGIVGITLAVFSSLVQH